MRHQVSASSISFLIIAVLVFGPLTSNSLDSTSLDTFSDNYDTSAITDSTNDSLNIQTETDNYDLMGDASAQTEASVQNTIGSGLQNAVKNCTGASGAISNQLGSILKSSGVGNIGSTVLKSATSGIGGGGIVGSAINKTVSIAGSALDGVVNNTINSAVKGVGDAAGSALGSATGGVSGALGGAQSAIMGVADSIVSGIGSAAGSVFQNIGVSLGSSGIADIGNIINSFTGEGLSGILSSFGSVSSMLGPVSGIIGGLGGGGPIPVADNKVQETTAAIKKKETCDDVLASAISRNIDLPKALSEAANWLNTGNSGDPFYPKNIADQYTSISKEQTNILISQIRGSNSPFANQLVPTVVKTSQRDTGSDISNQLKDTLPEIAGGQAGADKFRAGDPSACPGKQFYECFKNTAFNPGSSLLGSGIAVLNEYDKKQTEAKDKLDKELATNQGFLSNKKCVEYLDTSADPNNEEEFPSATPTCLRWETISPGIVAAGTAQKIAVAKIDAAANGNADGQGLAPILSSLGNQILMGGLSQLSKIGLGIAASINPYNRAVNNQIGSALSDAQGTANSYAGVLNNGIIVLQKIITDIGNTNSCYASVDTLLAGKDSGQTQSKPALEEINNNLPNIYQPGLADYQYKSLVLSRNPQMIASDADVNAIAMQVNTLKARQTSIAGYLASCRAQEATLSVERSSVSNSSGIYDQGGD